MGCSNTKFPLAAVADKAGVNPLSMMNSMDAPKVVVDAGDKLLNQASDVLSQASQALEDASAAITKNNPFGDTSSVKLEEAESAGETIDTVEEDTAGEENAKEGSPEDAANEATIDFVAICPSMPAEEGEPSEDAETKEEDAEAEGDAPAEDPAEGEEETAEEGTTDEPENEAEENPDEEKGEEAEEEVDKKEEE